MISDKELFFECFLRIIYWSALVDADHPYRGSLAQIKAETVVEWEAKS